MQKAGDCMVLSDNPDSSVSTESKMLRASPAAFPCTDFHAMPHGLIWHFPMVTC